jgi:hypothetical protein
MSKCRQREGKGITHLIRHCVHAFEAGASSQKKEAACRASPARRPAPRSSHPRASMGLVEKAPVKEKMQGAGGPPSSPSPVVLPPVDIPASSSTPQQFFLVEPPAVPGPSASPLLPAAAALLQYPPCTSEDSALAPPHL